ncbi:Uncharacterized protein Fot_28449 [Forsythia ovata]|uniref:Uncharacterized protein n=1 Tax=Forsythia ovata TaxID=205694 RepID=A0ABD1TPG5_9LAMI
MGFPFMRVILITKHIKYASGLCRSTLSILERVSGLVTHGIVQLLLDESGWLMGLWLQLLPHFLPGLRHEHSLLYSRPREFWIFSAKVDTVFAMDISLVALLPRNFFYFDGQHIQDFFSLSFRVEITVF